MPKFILQAIRSFLKSYSLLGKRERMQKFKKERQEEKERDRM